MRALLAASLAAFALAGCARSPQNGGVGQYTRLQFRFRYANPVVSGDPAAFTSGYYYIVAIRPLYAAGYAPKGVDATGVGVYGQDDGFGPVPVYGGGNGNPKNGFVEGRPTRFIQYDPTKGTTYQIYGFGTRDTSGTNDDNPIDLANIVSKGFPIASVDPTTSSDPNSLGFDIQTRDLVDDVTDAQSIVGIQFNIISCSRRLTNASDTTNYVVDSIGDQTQIGTTGKGYYPANIQTSTVYSSQRLTTTGNEVEGDTIGGTLPAVDLSSWSLTVATP